MVHNIITTFIYIYIWHGKCTLMRVVWVNGFVITSLCIQLACGVHVNACGVSICTVTTR